MPRKRTGESLREAVAKRRSEIIETQAFILHHLKTHPCVGCGETNISCLQFDHVRGEKVFAICNFIDRKATFAAVHDEIEKCDVRCGNCHTKRHGYLTPKYLSEAHVDQKLDRHIRKKLPKYRWI